MLRNLRLNTNLNIYELDRNKLSISRNWKTGNSIIPNFLYTLCNIWSHIVLSHIKIKRLKAAFHFFVFLTWVRSMSREKNVRFLVSMHRETKLMAGGRRHVLSWTASLKTVDFLVWLPYLYLQDGSVAAEDRRRKNSEEIKAKQSTWIASRLKPFCSDSLQSTKLSVGNRCPSHVKCNWQIMLSRVARAHKNITRSSQFCGEGTANIFCSFDWLYSGVTKKLKFKLLSREKFDEHCSVHFSGFFTTLKTFRARLTDVGDIFKVPGLGEKRSDLHRKFVCSVVIS